MELKANEVANKKKTGCSSGVALPALAMLVTGADVVLKWNA